MNTVTPETAHYCDKEIKWKDLKYEPKEIPSRIAEAVVRAALPSNMKPVKPSKLDYRDKAIQTEDVIIIAAERALVDKPENSKRKKTSIPLADPITRSGSFPLTKFPRGGPISPQTKLKSSQDAIIATTRPPFKIKASTEAIEDAFQESKEDKELASDIPPPAKDEPSTDLKAPVVAINGTAASVPALKAPREVIEDRPRKKWSRDASELKDQIPPPRREPSPLTCTQCGSMPQQLAQASIEDFARQFAVPEPVKRAPIEVIISIRGLDGDSDVRVQGA
jgi:hypothetical protein